MKTCTKSQAYFIYKCAENHAGYKMKRAKINDICEQRRDVTTAKIVIHREASRLYEKIAPPLGSVNFDYDENRNRLNYYEAYNFIKKVKDTEPNRHMKSCEECNYHTSCDAYINGKLKVS